MKPKWHDAVTLAGLGGVTYGLYIVHPALAWVAGGALMTFFGVWIQAKKDRK